MTDRFGTRRRDEQERKPAFYLTRSNHSNDRQGRVWMHMRDRSTKSDHVGCCFTWFTFMGLQKWKLYTDVCLSRHRESDCGDDAVHCVWYSVHIRFWWWGNKSKIIWILFWSLNMPAGRKQQSSSTLILVSLDVICRGVVCWRDSHVILATPPHTNSMQRISNPQSLKCSVKQQTPSHS